MKLIIAGSRGFTGNWKHVDFLLDWIGIKEEVSEVVGGEGGKADDAGKEWAAKYRIPFKPFPANWDKHGRSAGPVRNKEMAKYVGRDGALLAILDNSECRGTKSMIDAAKKQGVKRYVFYRGEDGYEIV